MIKTLIKHKITELAINAFFKQVNNNFNIKHIPKFYVGQQLKCIKCEELKHNNIYTEFYYDVDVLDVKPEYITIIYGNTETIRNNDIDNIIVSNNSYKNIWNILINNIAHVY